MFYKTLNHISLIFFVKSFLLFGPYSNILSNVLTTFIYKNNVCLYTNNISSIYSMEVFEMQL